jgi:hypothetical protein
VSSENVTRNKEIVARFWGAMAARDWETERWTFGTGEVIDHSFVSVTELRDGKIFRWHDYSNIPNITDNAPAWWLESVVKKAADGDPGR